MLPAPTIKLTAEQIASYNANGYLSLPAITTGEEVERLRRIYDRLFATKAGREKGDHFDLGGTDEENKEAVLPQILGPSQYAPELLETQLRANAIAIAHQLGGPGCEVVFDHAINKPPHSPAPTPWHQDEAYWADDTTYEHSLSIWIPFQDVDERSGCMQFIPGSNKLEVLPHHPINNDPRIHGLELDNAAYDVSKPAVCPLPAGGCTIHSGRTLHYTGPNNADVPRRAYILVAHTPKKALATPRNFYWNKQKQTARAERAAAAAAKK
jgi:ectoine hydroxylase-related dioxygenase (phytanoyl-CoA dioxygenase family)